MRWSTADRLVRVGVEHLEAVLAAHGRRVVVVESSPEGGWSGGRHGGGADRACAPVSTDGVVRAAGRCGRVTATKGDSVDEVPV